MNLVRNGNGDVHLVFVVVGGDVWEKPKTGFECNLLQGRAIHFDADPAEAIIGAVSKFLVNRVQPSPDVGPVSDGGQANALLGLPLSQFPDHHGTGPASVFGREVRPGDGL
jgi:hypothetical protein